MEDYRILDQIKHAQTVLYTMLGDREEENAKELITRFLKEYVKKVNIKNKIIQYTNKSKNCTFFILTPFSSTDYLKPNKVECQFEQNENNSPGQVFHRDSQQASGGNDKVQKGPEESAEGADD